MQGQLGLAHVIARSSQVLGMQTLPRRPSCAAQRAVKGVFARIAVLPVRADILSVRRQRRAPMSAKILAALGLNAIESGTSLGRGEWAATTAAGTLPPTNPATGEILATVQASSAADYETIVKRAQEAFAVWRNTPAPRRGEAVRLCGEALRKHKDALGSLVALEMGKIKPEGDGEVQEMIDIADFAVGQSRMLYGNTMHSERPGHRMYEQWHPIGVIGVISAFNFPVAVWSWNALLAAVCGDICLWKPSPKTPLLAIRIYSSCSTTPAPTCRRPLSTTSASR